MPDVAAVVFAQVQFAVEVWLNVVAKVDIERVRFAAGLARELQARLLLPLQVPHVGSAPLETRHSIATNRQAAVRGRMVVKKVALSIEGRESIEGGGRSSLSGATL